MNVLSTLFEWAAQLFFIGAFVALAFAIWKEID